MGNHSRDEGKGTSRRDLLKASGMGAIALGAGAASAQAGAQTPAAKTVDVVIVGAGFSGLAAARQLTKAGKSVAVLEARDRVGGRTKPGQIAGHTVDLGGMWVGPTQERLLALGEEFGVKRYLSPVAGTKLTEIGGEVRRSKETALALDPEALADLGRAIGEINELVAKVPIDAPWTAPDAKALDTKTMSAWIEEIAKHPQVRWTLTRLSETLFAHDTASLSVLHFLFYIHSGGDLSTMAALGDGAQKWLYHGGVHQIARKVGDTLGDRVVLNCPVARISQDDHGIEVATPMGAWKASRVIVAAAPTLCSRIRFSPPLPGARDKLTQRYPMGSTIKFWVAYSRPFWRDRGLNGYISSDSYEISSMIDATPDGAGAGFLVGFFEAGHAIAWGQKSQQERRDYVVGQIERLYGAEGGQPIDYVDNDWTSEEWSRGCYGGVPTPGTLTMLGTVLRQPVGRIHWAGTETAEQWTGYIDGAIRAGERAATEVLEAL